MALPPYMTGGNQGAPAPQLATQFGFHPNGPTFNSPQDTPKRNKARAVLGVVIGIAAACAFGGYQWYSSQKPQDALLLSAPNTQGKALCLDASGSVDADGHLASLAAKDFISKAKQLNHWQLVVPTDTPVAATAQLNLQVRVVRADSYSTRTDGGYARQYTIPPVRGLATAQPLNTDDAYETWLNAYEQVTLDQTAAREAQTQAAASIEELLHQRSDGSDITGCVAASLDAAPAGASTNILIVSDLQDTALTTSNGGPREFTGDYSTARLSIVQACPSGDPATCKQDAANFVARMASLGVPESKITIVRPEQLDQAMDTWLSEG